MTDPLEALWLQVAPIAQGRVALLEQAAGALRAGRPDAAGLQAVAEAECHKLIGSLDSYGRTGGSALAGRAQGLFAAEEPDLAELDAVISALRSLVGP